MRDALYRNRFVIYILAAALLVLGIGCAIVNVNSEKLLHVYEPVLTTEYGLPREEIDIPVMVFTHVEADEKLSSLKEERLRNEREEAERQEKAERKKETQATPTGCKLNCPVTVAITDEQSNAPNDMTAMNAQDE